MNPEMIDALLDQVDSDLLNPEYPVAQRITARRMVEAVLATLSTVDGWVWCDERGEPLPDDGVMDHVLVSRYKRYTQPYAICPGPHYLLAKMTGDDA